MPTPIISSSNMARPRLAMSAWPAVNGLNVPGNRAVRLLVDTCVIFHYEVVDNKILALHCVFAHIELMLTYFLQYFPDLIKKGHVYVLQTPLFRVRNKKTAKRTGRARKENAPDDTVYCYRL